MCFKRVATVRRILKRNKPLVKDWYPEPFDWVMCLEAFQKDFIESA